MNSDLIPRMCLLGVVLSPALGFSVLALWRLSANELPERIVSGIAKSTSLASVVFLAAIVVWMAVHGKGTYVAHYSPWFSFESHTFDIAFSLHPLSIGFLILTTILAGLVGEFSETYIHLEQGFVRFYMLLLLATFGMTVVVSTDSLGLTMIGWEFLGIASTLLIAFFHTRAGPIVNGLRTFIVYRMADIGLLVALIYVHHAFGTVQLNSIILTEGGPSGSFLGSEWQALILGSLLLFSATGKSSILPFFPWLPGAMEGPTPSSAIFYGAFAVHAGPYLFLRWAPLVSASPALSMLLVGLGLVSAIFATLVGRTRPDVKTSLAYATIAQVSLIYAEIGMHWYYVAAFHTAGHMCLRTYQFLRAPSALHDIHVRAALGVAAARRADWYVRFVPYSVQLWLFRLAFEHGGILALSERLIVSPFVSTGRFFSRLELASENALARILARGLPADSRRRSFPTSPSSREIK